MVYKSDSIFTACVELYCFQCKKSDTKVAEDDEIIMGLETRGSNCLLLFWHRWSRRYPVRAWGK